jgi:hypothetical protein
MGAPAQFQPLAACLRSTGTTGAGTAGRWRWLTIEGDDRDLADNAFVLEMLVVDESHQFEDCTWQGLGVRAISIENSLAQE